MKTKTEIDWKPPTSEDYIIRCVGKIDRLERENAKLLEALELIRDVPIYESQHPNILDRITEIASTAIAKHEKGEAN